MGGYTPVVEDGVLYNSGNPRKDYAFEAIQIPREAGAKPGVIWSVDGRAAYRRQGGAPFYTASPLYADGLVYQVDMDGHLVVIDTREKKQAYERWMDGYNWNNRYLYGYCSSPALAGKNIYLMDGAGYATILKPGADGTVVANNMLENITGLQWVGNAPCGQEVFYAGMYVEGRRLFLHGDEYLYCIEEE
jgi:outer membrane protein assembly factor BamB